MRQAARLCVELSVGDRPFAILDGDPIGMTNSRRPKVMMKKEIHRWRSFG
jgi:hypothetical protein